MIGKLKGIIDQLNDSYAILDVHGVGYKVLSSSRTLEKLKISQQMEFLIETHVREDLIQLIGFENLQEQKIFNLFCSVKGVGIRMALGILSKLSVEQIQNSLMSRDPSPLSKVSGIGKKLAERIIIELKDKFSINNENNLYFANSFIDNNVGLHSNEDKQKIEDAISALVNLGINKHEAYDKVINYIRKDKEISISDLVKSVLMNNN